MAPRVTTSPAVAPTAVEPLAPRVITDTAVVATVPNNITSPLESCAYIPEENPALAVSVPVVPLVDVGAVAHVVVTVDFVVLSYRPTSAMVLPAPAQVIV